MDYYPNPGDAPRLIGPASTSGWGGGGADLGRSSFRILPNQHPEPLIQYPEQLKVLSSYSGPPLKCSFGSNRPRVAVPEPLKSGEEHGLPSSPDNLLAGRPSPRYLLQDHMGNRKGLLGSSFSPTEVLEFEFGDESENAHLPKNGAKASAYINVEMNIDG